MLHISLLLFKIHTHLHYERDVVYAYVYAYRREICAGVSIYVWCVYYFKTKEYLKECTTKYLATHRRSGVLQVPKNVYIY